MPYLLIQQLREAVNVEKNDGKLESLLLLMAIQMTSACSSKRHISAFIHILSKTNDLLAI